ncbi:MAG: HlyD family secretion protein [Pirellulaceae bacterium]
MSTIVPEFEKDSPREPRLLSPIAYSETALPSLRLARSSRLAKTIGRILFYSLIAGTLLVSFAPWQQSVKGSGSVIALNANQRPQTMEAPIEGRVMMLGEGIQENARVKKGDLIMQLADIDRDYQERLDGQFDATVQARDAAKNIVQQNEFALTAAKGVVVSLEAKRESYVVSLKDMIRSLEAGIEAARKKIESKEQELVQAEAALAQIEPDVERERQIYAKDLSSKLKLDQAERKLIEAKAKVKKARADIAEANSLLLEKQEKLKSEVGKFQGEIDSIQSYVRKAEAEVNKAEAGISKAKADLNKADKEVLVMRTKVERQDNGSVYAPFDGTVTKITPNNETQILKKGDPLCVVVPDTSDRAVQITLSGLDSPLVEPGRHVRLLFEGWPGIQFAGWPSVAVGTFGGQVQSIDAMDNGKGKFRILITPDEADVPWPNERFLRQGALANGWVLLDEVPLWYEIWRNMNGFPPVVSMEEPEEKGSKPPKLPKI